MKTITTLVLLDNIQEPLYPVLYHSLEYDPILYENSPP